MIKNKNGKEYKISKPNPIMKFQSLWNNYIMHNFFWEELKEINLIKKVKEKVIEEEKEEAIEKEEEEEKTYKKEPKFKNQCYYIEFKKTTQKDNLYEEEKTKIKYKEKKLIIVKIKQHNDLYLQFLIDKKLNKNSIIFPKNKDKRWWKIIEEEKEEKEENNYIYSCIPSDFAPSHVSATMLTL